MSGRTDDGQLTGDVRPAQTDVIWMSDSTAEYAKYVTIIHSEEISVQQQLGRNMLEFVFPSESQ